MPSRTTVRVLSTNISKTEGCGVGEAAGRPPGLGLLQPLLNQPGFGVFLDPDLPLMMSAPPGAARDPSSPTSVRLLHRWHRVPKPNQRYSNRTWKVKHRPGAMRDVRRSQPD